MFAWAQLIDHKQTVRSDLSAISVIYIDLATGEPPHLELDGARRDAGAASLNRGPLAENRQRQSRIKAAGHARVLKRARFFGHYLRDIVQQLACANKPVLVAIRLSF